MMLFSSRNRGKVMHNAGCDCCNVNVIVCPKTHRRTIKRTERNQWKKEVAESLKDK